MNTGFSADFFRENRAKLQRMFTGTAPIVITANGSLQKAMDEAFPFHQDRSFWYLTGIDEPSIALVIDKGKEYLIVPPREVVREQFDGSISLEKLMRISGIETIYYEKEGWKYLAARLKKIQNVAMLGANPKFIDFFGMYTNPARADLIQKMKDCNPNLEFLDLRKHLSRMRMVKQQVELAAIQRAIDITIDALKEVMRPAKLAKYKYEYEVEADLTRGFRRRGAQGHAFSPIVSTGERTCTLHQMRNEMPIEKDSLLLMDVGAQYDYYAADLTRTVAIGAQPTKRQQQVYNAVIEAQDYACTLLKPGVILKDYERAMEHFIGEKLRELGLIKTIDRDVVRRYFPHATSHFLGLDVHDAGDHDLPLESGVVITVEPGIYIPEESTGIRLEDNILITPSGNENLSARLSRNLC
jgi:Xaa-Pro aminopeptidase